MRFRASQKNVADSFHSYQASKMLIWRNKEMEKEKWVCCQIEIPRFCIAGWYICNSHLPFLHPLCVCVCIICPSKPAKHCKTGFKYFRRTAPSICIPLTHSKKRHLSRNTADKRETINPRKITGTESLSCILPEMRQKSHHVHPSGLPSDSEQCRGIDVVLFKGTLHLSAVWSIIILLESCFLECLAFFPRSSALFSFLPLYLSNWVSSVPRMLEIWLVKRPLHNIQGSTKCLGPWGGEIGSQLNSLTIGLYVWLYFFHL